MKAIVTGHSRGLGAALVAELLAHGAHVLGLARSAAAAPAKGLEQIAVDLADPAALAGLVAGDGALRRFLAGAGNEPLLLINNAGMVEPVGPAGTLDPAAIGRAVALNVTAPLVLADAFIAATEGAGDRRVIHISSGAARQPYAGWSIYCATKAALDRHAQAVAADARPGLRIGSLAPGVVDTDMQTELRALPEERFGLRERFVLLKENGVLLSPAESARRILSYLLLPDFGTPPLNDIRQIGE